LTIDHKSIYNTNRISRDYETRDYLAPAEKAVIDELGESLSLMNMLDMGVGGGRTTKYFAPLVNSYIGADYAPAMIQACKRRYGDTYSFIECDVRKMDMFEDDSFDFVFFSYNGIDSFSHNDRLSALKEIRRVLRSEGYLYFSSHNLDWYGLEDIFSLRKHKFSRKIDDIARHTLKIVKLKLLNRSFTMNTRIRKIRANKKGHIYDNSLNGKACVYYISLDEQLEQLTDHGFTDIKTFGLDGKKTAEPEYLNSGGWIYYLCK
jgi:ubiquinone/menaquinone biosynthesis C-methylase UbiE